MILFASENEQVGQSFVQDLEQEGFQVKWFASYQDIISELYQHLNTYDMIILDMASNVEATTDLCQKLKSHSQFKLKPLICLVQKDYVVEQLIAFELGADEFIYVPYTSVELQLRMRMFRRLLELQKELEEKRNQLKAIKQIQQILVTLSHHINNSLTPLYTMVQIMNEKNEEDARRLKEFAINTVKFTNKVLRTLNELVQSGEMKVVQEGVYKDLLLDIEQELKKLQQEK